MGCDVHLHIEVKIEDEWHHLNHLEPKRNYAMFAKMAGVRNDSTGETPLALPRGLPGDATKLTLIDSAAWGSDGHHHSWLSWEEVEDLDEFAEHLGPMGPKEEGCQFEVWLGNRGAVFLFEDGWERGGEGAAERGITDLRFVFWFDN